MGLPLSTSVMIASCAAPGSGSGPALIQTLIAPAVLAALNGATIIGIDIYNGSGAITLTDVNGGDGSLGVAVGATQQLPCVSAEKHFKVVSQTAGTAPFTAYLHIRRDAAWI